MPFCNLLKASGEQESCESSTPHAKIHHSTVDLSGVSSPETSHKETESKKETPGRHAQLQLKGSEGGARPKTVPTLMRTRQETPTVAHSLHLAAEEFRKIREPQMSTLKGGY